MGKLIDKDALIAEIEKRLKYNSTRAEIDRSAVMAGRGKEDEDILSLLNTLEVKEEDLEKEIQAFALLELEPLKIYDANVGISITMHQLYQCAKHFFALGLKAKQG